MSGVVYVLLICQTLHFSANLLSFTSRVMNLDIYVHILILIYSKRQLVYGRDFCFFYYLSLSLKALFFLFRLS